VWKLCLLALFCTQVLRLPPDNWAILTCKSDHAIRVRASARVDHRVSWSGSAWPVISLSGFKSAVISRKFVMPVALSPSSTLALITSARGSH
jgi:hypothetical protein